MKKKLIYNTHIHLLNQKYIPEYFLPLKLVRLLANKKITRKLAKFLNYLNPFSSTDLFNRYSRFMTIGAKNSQKEIFEQIYNIYEIFALAKGINPDNLRFVVLSMDLAYIYAGDTEKDFITQLEELSNLSEDPQYNGKIIPFMCIDIRRKGILELLQIAIENYNIQGVKLYPALGYYPFDSKLIDIYEMLTELQIPIISHCSKGGIYNKKESQKVCQKFSNPDNYIPILEKFPKLRISLAHMGGEKDVMEFVENKTSASENWFEKIYNLLHKYDNLFTDISYTLYIKKLYPILKLLLRDSKIRKKILFGSDWYMVTLETQESSFLELIDYLSKEDFLQIANINPERFLYGL